MAMFTKQLLARSAYAFSTSYCFWPGNCFVLEWLPPFVYSTLQRVYYKEIGKTFCALPPKKKKNNNEKNAPKKNNTIYGQWPASDTIFRVACRTITTETTIDANTNNISLWVFPPPPSTESNSCEVGQRLISLFLLVFTTWPRNWLTHIFLLAVKLLYLLAALAGMPENSNTCRPSGYASFYLRAVYVCASVWVCSLKNTCATGGYWIFQTRKAGGTSTGH